VLDSSISITVAANSPGSPPEPVLVDWVPDQEVQFVHFTLAEDLVEEEYYVIRLDFTGDMGTPGEGQGLYWDSYEEVDGATVSVYINFYSSQGQT